MDRMGKRRLIAASVIVVVALIGVVALWVSGQSGRSQAGSRGSYCLLADIDIRGIISDAYKGNRNGTARNPSRWIVSSFTSRKTVNEAPKSLIHETQTVTKALNDAVANRPVDLKAIGPAIDAVNNWGKVHCKVAGDTNTGS